ncbi:MAG: hypothetical protein L0Y36_07225, partial [Planctomycetales bacterium]|nr:hypothetical protein [Planctomycetales bacterium]
MKKAILFLVAVCTSTATIVSADTFGTGENQFEIEFVTISGDASGATGTDIGYHKTFLDPEDDYCIGAFEITYGQWDKFKAEL